MKKNFFDILKGDKVIWMITLMLMLFSIVCIFSSSSRLLKEDQTRIDMVLDQVKVVGAGLAVIIACCCIKSYKVFRWFSKWGFLLSLAILLFLHFGPHSGPVRVPDVNSSRRIIMVGNFQVFVPEIVKVAMVMYFAWAVDAFKKKELKWIPADRPWLQKLVFLYAPFLIITVLLMDCGNTAAIFIGAVFILTILLGLCDVRDFAIMVILGVVGFASCYGLYTATDGKWFSRMEILTSGSRVNDVKVMEQRYHDAAGAKAKENVINGKGGIAQPYSARIAIQSSKFIGKGPGQSTQRYIVADFSEDYMFSFIIEEYGLLGAILIIIMYVSLLARGTLIVKNCGKDSFPKTAVAGLTILITVQAFLHMLVNVGIFPVTGQTLPLISHGAGSFLCFCVAFGVLLSISRIAQKEIEKAERDAEPIIDLELDNVSASVNELDNYDI